MLSLAVVPTQGFAVGCLLLCLFPSTWVCPPEGGPLCNPDRVTCPQGGGIVYPLPLAWEAPIMVGLAVRSANAHASLSSHFSISISLFWRSTSLSVSLREAKMPLASLHVLLYSRLQWAQLLQVSSDTLKLSDHARLDGLDKEPLLLPHLPPMRDFISFNS